MLTSWQPVGEMQRLGWPRVTIATQRCTAIPSTWLLSVAEGLVWQKPKSALRVPHTIGEAQPFPKPQLLLSLEHTLCSSLRYGDVWYCVCPGAWPQSSISRSLQRAEALLRTTFNPSLKWLLRRNSQEKESGEEEEVEEEGSFVAAHNLVSRSSARVLRLQQGMLCMAPQRPLVRESKALLQVCVKGSSQEGCVIQQLSSPTQQGCFRALWSLMEQRSQLLFVHEYARRAHCASAYVSRLDLLVCKLGRPHLTLNKKSCDSFSLKVLPLSQELRVHLNHWSCLSTKVRSDTFLRLALAPQTNMLVGMKRCLDSLALQALVLMENCVHAILSTLAQTDIESIAREVLEDIFAGTELYNQVVEEHRGLHSVNQSMLQSMCYSGLPVLQSAYNGASHPATVQVKQLLKVFAVHHGNRAAKEMHHWATEQNRPESHLGNHTHPQAHLHSQRSGIPEWTWERLEHTYYLPSPGSPPLLPSHQSAHISNPSSADRLGSSERASLYLAQHTLAQCRAESQTRAEPATQRRRRAARRAPEPSNTREPTLGQPVPGQMKPGGCPEVQAETDPYLTACRSAVVPLSAFCQHDQFSLELLFQAMLSSSELLTPLVPRIPTPECLGLGSAFPVQRTRNKVVVACRQTDSVVSHGDRTDGRSAPDSLFLKSPRLEQHPGQSSERGPKDHMEPGPLLVPEPLPRYLNKYASSVEVCLGGLDLSEWNSANKVFKFKWLLSRSGDPPPYPPPPAAALGEQVKGEEREIVPEQELFHRPRSVKWLDRGHSSVCAELFGEYRTLLWSVCGQALWQHFQFPTGGAIASVNLCSDHQKFLLLHTWRNISTTDLVPQECRAMLEKFCLHLLVLTAHTHWDQGSGLKDKCLPGTTQERRLMTSPEQDGSLAMTATVKHLLQLSPPLLSAIRCHLLADSIETGSVGVGPSSPALCRATAHLAVASVQSSLMWVMSKAYQFLSSWSLDKFLLITQGDLKVLQVSLERLLQQMETLIVDGANDLHHYRHHHVLLCRQIVVIRSSVSELQAYSSVVLKIFSSGCKQMSGEIFEQTMPSAKHWRLNYKTEFPSSPSEYASFAAQSVIGQVLEGVAPLSDDARVQTLSITMTAFMEAWMEHILKQKIKFSIQGALQLKQDFNLIRELIQSDQYSLSAELHQRLLHLRVFQQVDSAVVCLLQQPQAEPYLQTSGWEPFRRCCEYAVSPTTSSGRSSIDVAIGGSITNLDNMEGEVLTQCSSSPLAPDAPTTAPISPSQTYLAPSLALGAAQQEWLDLRIHNSASRWRLPGLQCLSKSEH
ncbi:Coiled-coil domain-containing protein 142 [Merluccius polli]|uniref:Coiled-coil domain-containing protein 142 n=1 Tax=Merluccius polli TaxID=89951 RepID=A0AA47N9C7_MERPO|nr:Coiled-coil domain-containing protein 142 [Merluccius polli]